MHIVKNKLPHLMVQQSIPLADKNWFKTGGNARYFIEPTHALQMQEAFVWAHTNQIPFFILGSGANILIHDEGFDGLVIRPRLMEITQKKIDATVHVTAAAGVSIDMLIEYCLAHDLIGLEEFSGIPGTVGGAVYINLHYFEFLFSHFLIHADVINVATGVIEQVDNAWFQFGYNMSRLHSKDYSLLTATFAVRQASTHDIAYAKGRRTEIIRHRNKRYPQQGTCGSFFRNFFEHEVTLESDGKKVIWVAYYLDKIGVKGVLRCGDAHVSHQHANMIVNQAAATSNDIITVARQMQERVYDAFGIVPQPECQLVGFAHYPLI